MKSLWSILKQTGSAWNDHNAPTLGAALAFYTILSLAPLLIFVVAIAAAVFGDSTAREQILSQVQELVGTEGANAVRTMIEHAQQPSQQPAPGIFASIAGVVTILFGASGVFNELRSALNLMWDVKPRAGSGVSAVLGQRFFSVGMVIAIGFLLLVSLIISAALAAVGKFFGGILPMPESVLNAMNFAISLAGISILFALIFKYVPEARIAWREVWIGAVTTAFLFTIGKFLIGLYLGKAGVASAYGAAGSLMVIVIWIYYSSMIFFFGAEFTHVLATRDQVKVS